MAKFPIYTTERSLPGVGPAAYGRLDADTGAGAVARAVGQAGGALADVGMTIFRAQGEAELTEKMAEAAQRVSEMHLRFEQNLDETTYQQDFDQTFGEIENMEFKNGWARRQWNLRLPMMRQRQQELAKEAYHKRIRWKWDQAYTNEKAKAIETGNLRNFNVLLQSGLDKKFFTQDFVESERRDAKRLAQRREIIALLSSDPSKVKGLDNWEEFHSHYRHQIPEDFRYFQGLKQQQEAWLKRNEQMLTRQQLDRIYAAVRKGDIDELTIRISQSDALSEEQKLTAMKVVNSAAEIWNRKGVNPWLQTQNFPALAQASRKVHNGQIKTYEGLLADCLRNQTVNYSWNDFEQLDRLRTQLWGDPLMAFLPGGENAAPDPVASQYLDSLLKLWDDARDDSADVQAMMGDVSQLQQAIEQHRDDPAALEKAVSPVIEKAKEKKARRVFYGWAAMKKGFGYWWQPRTMFGDLLTGRYMMVEEEEIPTPQTQAEYDALPAGARYIDKEDGQVYVKR